MRKASRYYFRLLTSFLGRFKELLIASAVFGVLLFLVLRFILPFFIGRSVEKIAVTGRHTSSDLPYPILNLIGEGLTAIDENGRAKPAVAESWETPDEGKTWVFKLKEGLTWQDGTPVIASAAMYSFEDVDITVPDQRTIEFKLQSPFAPFPTVVSKPTFKRGLLGTGKWRVANISLAGEFVSSLELTNNDGAKIIYKFYPTEERSKLAFKLGEVDRIEDLIDPRPLDKWNTVNLTQETNQKRFVAVFFNTQDPLLSDKKMRQALSYATDKEKLSSVRSLGPLSPNSWAYNPQIKPYDFDSARAKELIAEVKKANTELSEPKIKLVTSPLLLDAAEEIAKDWHSVGVETTVQVQSVLPENFQAFLVIYDIPTDPDQYATWHSTQLETNITKYNNPRVDKLLEDARVELDLETRKKMYLDFQRFLLEDAPAVFLYHPISYTIIRK